jgi:hypothetical protein
VTVALVVSLPNAPAGERIDRTAQVLGSARGRGAARPNTLNNWDRRFSISGTGVVPTPSVRMPDSAPESCGLEYSFDTGPGSA